MEKKQKSKSIFSLFSLDWDDKPKSKSEKPPKISQSDSNRTSRSHQDPKANHQSRSRSTDKIPPQPAPRIRSKTVKEELPQSSSHSSSKRHSVVLKKRRSPSPFPSPRFVPEITTESEENLKTNSNQRSDQARAERDEKIKRKSSSSKIFKEQNTTKPKSSQISKGKSTFSTRDETEDLDVKRALEYLDNSTRFPPMDERKKSNLSREKEVSQRDSSRDHSSSSSRSKSTRSTKDKTQSNRLTTEDQIKLAGTDGCPQYNSVTPSTGFPNYVKNRPTASSPSSSPASSRQASVRISANYLPPKPKGSSENKSESRLGYTSVEQMRRIAKLSIPNASKTTSKNELDGTAKERGREAPGYQRHLEQGQAAITTHHHVNDLPSEQQHVPSDKTFKTRAHRKADQTRQKLKLSGLRHGGGGSTRNLNTLNKDYPDLFKSGDDRFGIGSEQDLTFEKAVLALIRLRRLDTRLRQNRQSYVQELQLFRGWSDERYIHLLDQIAKCNRQMDELDPLIASLEEFINEQHSPPFVPEDEVLRYPVSLDPRKVFSGYQSNGSYPIGYEYGDQPMSSSRAKIQAMGLPSSFISQNSNTDNLHLAPRTTQSIGRNGLYSGNGSRPTILQVDGDPSSEIDRELDALTNQVRQLQMQQEMLHRNSTDSNRNGTIELRRLSHDQRNEQPKRTGHIMPSSTKGYEDGNAGKAPPSSLRNVQESERDKLNHGPTSEELPKAIVNLPSNAKKSGGHTSSSLTSPTSSSDEVSVDEPYQYEDFTDTALYDSYFDDSMTKLQNVMRDLEQRPSQATDRNTGFYTHSDFAGYSDYRQENGLPDTSAIFSSHGYPPLPPTRKLKNGPATKIRRHHTISSGNPSAIYAARRAYSERNSDNETLSDDIIPSRKSSLNDEEPIAYDFQLRLNSPDPITIPERYLDAEIYEQEDDIVKKQRIAKAEVIRRMLAVPEPGTSDRDQREREKVLLMTPILAREVTERSRRVALQAKNRIGR